MFSCEFCEIFKSTFFYRTLLVAPTVHSAEAYSEPSQTFEVKLKAVNYFHRKLHLLVKFYSEVQNIITFKSDMLLIPISFNFRRCSFILSSS